MNLILVVLFLVCFCSFSSAPLWSKVLSVSPFDSSSNNNNYDLSVSYNDTCIVLIVCYTCPCTHALFGVCFYASGLLLLKGKDFVAFLSFSPPYRMWATILVYGTFVKLKGVLILIAESARVLEELKKTLTLPQQGAEPLPLQQ